MTFTDIDAECLMLIADHLHLPVDVFSLVLSSKILFFGDYFDQRRKAPLATGLLQAAMLRGLKGRLQQHQHDNGRMERWGGGAARRAVNLSLGTLFPPGINAEGPPQVILAGSLVVQAALAKKWKGSDIDIFCTWTAAPVVRRALIDHCLLMCSGACDTYSSPSVSELNTIDHVEGYAARPSDENCDIMGSQTPFDVYYEQALANGVEAIRADSPNVVGHRSLRPKRIGLPNGSAGALFPYDYDLERATFVQLVVGKESSCDARDMLGSFDLSICQTSFDGQRFRLSCAPEDLFHGRTWSLEPRRTLIQDYLASEMVCEEESEDGTYMLDDIIAGMKQWPLVGFTNYDPAVVEARQTAWWQRYKVALDAGLPMPDDNDPSDDPNWGLRHEYVQKLLVRIQKYAKRGIEIVNPPLFALHYQTRFNCRGDYCDGPKPVPLPDSDDDESQHAGSDEA